MSWLNDIKNKFLDDEGLFQRGKFAPLKKLGNNIRASVAPKPVVTNSYQPRQSFQQPQLQSLPVLEPPKPTFKTDAANKLSARLDNIKRYGTSTFTATPTTVSPLKSLLPAPIESRVTQIPKVPVSTFWDKGLGKSLVKAQEFTKPMADNMEQSIKTYKEDPTKIVTEGLPKLAKGLLIETPKAMGRWAWNTGELLSGKKQQELDEINREQTLKNKIIWNKLEVARRYRESGNIEMADKYLNEAKNLNNGTGTNVYDDFAAKNEAEKNQYIADAITTGMTVAGAGTPLNPKNLIAGGAISGGIGLVSGKDPFEEAGKGIANAQRWKAVTQFTNPAITKTINTFVNEKTAPFVASISTKLISGTGNVVEDRLIDKLEMKDRTIVDDITSFVLGAVMGNADPSVGKWKKSDFSPDTIKKQLVDDLTISGKLDPKDTQTLNNVVDKIISLGVNPDGSLKMRSGKTNLLTAVAPEVEVKPESEFNEPLITDYIRNKYTHNNTTYPTYYNQGKNSEIINKALVKEWVQKQIGRRIRPDEFEMFHKHYINMNSQGDPQKYFDKVRYKYDSDVPKPEVYKAQVDSIVKEIQDNNQKITFGTDAERKIAEAKDDRLHNELLELERLYGKKDTSEEDFDWARDAETTEGLADKDYYPEKPDELIEKLQYYRNELARFSPWEESTKEFKSSKLEYDDTFKQFIKEYDKYVAGGDEIIKPTGNKVTKQEIENKMGDLMDAQNMYYSNIDSELGDTYREEYYSLLKDFNQLYVNFRNSKISDISTPEVKTEVPKVDMANQPKDADTALSLFEEGKKTISDEKYLRNKLKENGYDISKITIKGEPLPISKIFDKHKIPDKPIELSVSGQRVPVEDLKAENWDENQIVGAMKKLEQDGGIPPGKMDSWIRKALKDLNPNAKFGKTKSIPLPPEPSAEEIARMDRNVIDQPIKTEPKFSEDQLMERNAGIELPNNPQSVKQNITQTIKVSDLPDRATAIGMPHDKYEIMAADIKKNGIINPIVIDKKTGQVLDGMHRAFVAERLGLEEIPVKYVDGSKITLDDARKIGGSYNEHLKRANEKYLDEHPQSVQPIKTGEIKSPSITSNRPDLTNEKLNKGFGEIDDLHTIDPKTGKLISKTEPQVNKVTTPEEIVKPRASGEVTEPKKTKINEVLSPEQAQIRKSNEKEIKKLLEGGFEPKTKAEPNYKIKGFDARSRYSKVDVNTIKDQELRTKVRAVKNIEAWAADNKIKNAEGKIDSGWAEVAKVEEKIKAQKDNPVEMETIIRNVNTEEGMETVFEQRPKRKVVNDDYAAFDQKPPEGGKPPKKDFDPTKDKQKTEKVVLTDEEVSTKDTTIKERLTKWAGKIKQGRSMATNQAKQFSEIPSKLRDEIINAREKTNTKPSAEAEKYAGKFGQAFDILHKIATKYGVDVNFRKDFFTHLWKTDADGNLIKNGRTVSSKPYFTKKQQLTWQEGLDMGLEPRFKTAQEALEAYSTALYKSIANKQLIDGLKKDKLAFDEQVGYQYKPVAISGYRNELDNSNILYLPKKSAEMFEKVFNPKQAEAWWEKGLEATAKFGKGATQTVLSGGYRALNAMGIGKLFFKELPSGNFNAFKRFGQAMSDSGAEKLYKDIEPDIKWLQGLGVDISAGKQNVADYISDANYGRGIGDRIKRAFRNNMESPTFDYFIPATQVDFARSIRKAGIKQGLSTDEVNKAVVDAMKQHYDVGNSLDSMLKNKNLNNLLDSFFFAKTLRKSTFMSNGVNTVKALFDPTALKNRGNIKQVVGSVISLALLNEVNKASTGNNMWENPDGWQYAYIKYGKDKEDNDKYIRLNTTNIEYTWLTQGLKLTGSIGDNKKFASAAKAPLQFGVGQLVDLMSNTDYKMDKIWQGSDTADVKAKKITDYLVTEFSHPIVKNVKTFLDKPDDEQKVEKLLGGLSESPISFKTSKTYSNAQYYKSVDEVTSKLSEEDKKIYESITKKQTEFGAKQRDKVADAQMLVNYPNVMKAQKEIAIINAKKTKTKLDPLYELSDEQLKTFYQIQGLGNNRDAQKDLKEANQWYSDLSEARGEHFKELIASGKMKEQENDYPQAKPETQKKLDYLKQLKTPEIKKKQDYYYTLPLGTGARKAYLNANPDLRKYWDTKNAFEDANPDIQEYWDEVNGYYVKVDEAFGIIPKEEESTGSGWQNWGNYKKKSEYEKLQDSLEKLKKSDHELSRKLSKKITDLLSKSPETKKSKTIGSFFNSNKLSATRKIPLTGIVNRVKRKSYLYS